MEPSKTLWAAALLGLGVGVAGAEEAQPQKLELKPIADARLRYEFGDQDGKEEANATTLRLRLGAETPVYNGFSGLIEFEGTRALDSDLYNAAGVDGDPARTVIADPESTELNRAVLSYQADGQLVKLGRQRIILDNARFIGNVGWRQNEQTFDAISYKNTMIKDLSLYYAYIRDVNRIFGSESVGAQNHFESDSHLINVSYSGLPLGKLTAYAYLLDFENAEANSSDTFGVSYSASGKVAEDYTLSGYAEYAHQTEGDNAPLAYDANYYHLNTKLARAGYSVGLGYEVLGSDNGAKGFATPLATGHKFNGFADEFLATPADGLKDFYVSVGAPLPGKVPLTLIYHNFSSDEGSTDYGQEFDAVAKKKLAKGLTAVAKLAVFSSEEETPGAGYNFDRTRFSVQLDYKF